MFELSSIPVSFPEKEIFLRLEGNIYKTKLDTVQRTKFISTAKKAHALCTPKGRWDCLTVQNVTEKGILLENGIFVQGGDFAARCGGITHLWFGAVTAGSVVAEAEKNCEDISCKAIFDAAASETADAAMDFLHGVSAKNLLSQGLSLDKRRYSPGYGDMPLAMQKIFFSHLHLDELGMVLCDNFYMIPEKSVTAFAAVRKITE